VSEAWKQVTVASVVEGDGEVPALPKVLHRIAADLGVVTLQTPRPMREPRGRIIRAGGIERLVEAAALRVPGDGGVIVLIDADDDCPAELGPQLLERARAVRPDKRIAVVLANREFEAWFMAAAPSLAGKYGFPGWLKAPDAPEKPRDCKGWIKRTRGSYEPPVDQAPLASIFDMKLARQHSDSFDKFYRDVTGLLGGTTD
jgi:hypothetical protein